MRIIEKQDRERTAVGAAPRGCSRASIDRATGFTRAIRLVTLGLALGAGANALACTVFCDAQGDTVLVGRSWEMTECEPVMWVVSPRVSAHGRICFGRHDDCEDGMNDAGLFVAVAAAPPDGRFWSGQEPVAYPAALDRLLAQCATVDEAVRWCVGHTNIGFNNRITKGTILSHKGDYRNSGMGGHLLIADRSGQSAVCEWERGRLKVIRKTERCQVITNFLLSKPGIGGAPCPRFAAATAILGKAGNPSVAACEAVLKATSRESTRYSVIYDLGRGVARVYCRRRFDAPKTVHLREELRRGAREVKLDAWFAPSPETESNLIVASEWSSRPGRP